MAHFSYQQPWILTKYPTEQNEYICNEDAQGMAGHPTDQIKDNQQHIPQRNDNTTEREFTDYFLEFENGLYNNPQPNYNTTQKELTHPYFRNYRQLL
ncbi:hypothetical protein C922_05754 [Plasmodium inui San Antonio 1]|uniref:Uncharacterized protein n=1 Tax=Plasmodium inui San Antonio 1 TaxID=1237626 RepID=W6ZX77_9APIC|nr:hypothetical protein C922_05754 [Plasmodium inui San Antonio 1]EUD63865.1 hypothetical protein C922_05754 [Plasmodium inui San Antonio 1]